MITQVPVGKCEELSGNNSFLLLSFNTNANLWTSATPVTGNVRAVGLPTPVYDEWSTMWGENQQTRFRDAKTDQNSLYKAINEKGVYSDVSFLVQGSERSLIML